MESKTTQRLVEGPRTGQRGVTAIVWLVDDSSANVTLLNQQRLVLGRGAGVNISLACGGVSRHHAELRRQGPIYAIGDLGSTNGTFLNGARVQVAALSSGDVVRLGDAVGVVVRLSSGADVVELTQIARGLWFGPSVEDELRQLRRVARSDLPVVLVGETGVGKEHFAKALHLLSGREGGFHAVNCAALPPSLAEAELFGYRRGAFTGAEQGAAGLFRAADGGTLLLDELGDLPPAVQAKLLRVLQDKQVTPLGESRSVVADVRIVAAGQQSLTELVAAQRLRADLAARLAGLELVIPPLRSRRPEIALLFKHFLDGYSGGRSPRVEPRLLECLLLHSWPGNVRELELTARRLLVLHGSEPSLRPEFLPASFGVLSAPASGVSAPRPALLTPPAALARKQHDSERLAGALRAHDGNITRAAKEIGISRQRAYRLLAERNSSERNRQSGSERRDRQDGV